MSRASDERRYSRELGKIWAPHANRGDLGIASFHREVEARWRLEPDPIQRSHRLSWALAGLVYASAKALRYAGGLYEVRQISHLPLDEQLAMMRESAGDYRGYAISLRGIRLARGIGTPEELAGWRDYLAWEEYTGWHTEWCRVWHDIGERYSSDHAACAKRSDAEIDDASIRFSLLELDLPSEVAS